MGSIVAATPAVTVLEKQRLGFFALTLSNWSTSGIPQIIGNVEVAGSLYTFDALETVTDYAGVGAGPVWIKLIPALPDTISAKWTAVAPAWDDEKQGWYSPTGGEENQRYAFSATKVDGSNVTVKREMQNRAMSYDSDLADGYHVAQAATASTIPVRDASGRMKAAAPSASDDVATKAYNDDPRTNIHGYVYASASQDSVFDAMSPAIPNVNDSCLVTGAYGAGAVVSRAVRTASNVITLYTLTTAGSLTQITITDGGGGAAVFGIAW